jgi:hypothetical protein
MSFSEPSSGYGHARADLSPGWGNFTVTPSVQSGKIRFTVTDTSNLLTSLKMLRAVIGDAIDQWLATNQAQLVTNSVIVSDDPNIATISGSVGSKVGHSGVGDGFYGFTWKKNSKYAETPAITTTSLTTAAITVTIPYADVV